MSAPTKDSYFIQSLAKGLYLLQTLAGAGKPLTLTEISKVLRTTKTSAKRFCHTLCKLGYIHCDEKRLYSLTPSILSLGYASLSNLEWREIAKYYMEQLFKEMNETVNLSVLEGQDILYIIRVRKRNYLPIDILIGTRLPLYCTAMGKALLAWGEPNKVKEILKKIQFKPLTPRTITNLKDFQEELRNTREKGYAISDEETIIGNRAVAGPILDKDGFAFASINMAVPSNEYTKKEVETILSPPLVRIAKQISEVLLQHDNRKR